MSSAERLQARRQSYMCSANTKSLLRCKHRLERRKQREEEEREEEVERTEEQAKKR